MFQKITGYLKKFFDIERFEGVAASAFQIPGTRAYAVVEAKHPVLVVEEIYSSFRQAEGRAKFLKNVFNERYFVLQVYIRPEVVGNGG